MRILFACHKHPFRDNPRGAEKSVKIIMEYLSQWHEVTAYVENCSDESLNNIKYIGGDFTEAILNCDIAFCWASIAEKTAKKCMKYNKPYILMVRWFRLIQPLPPGDLMKRPIDKLFTKKHDFIFKNAASIITNTNYVCKVIKRYYGVKAITSYVPVLGEPEKQGNKNGYVTLVTPSQDLGEWPLIKTLSAHENIFVANCKDEEINTYSYLPIVMSPYVDMECVWQNTSILIMPVYYNDRNGQGRVTTEAHRRGIPVISVDRCGMGEIIPKEHLLNRNASAEEWIKKIKEIRENYSLHEEIAINAFYPAEEQLRIFQQQIIQLQCKQNN